MRSTIINRQCPLPPSTGIDTILHNPTKSNGNSCARVPFVHARTHAHARNSPRNAATVRRVHSCGTRPTPIIPHSQTTPLPLLFRHSHPVYVIPAKAGIHPASNLTIQNPRTILDPWALNQTQAQGDTLQSPIINPQSAIRNQQSALLQLALGRTRQNPTECGENSCAHARGISHVIPTWSRSGPPTSFPRRRESRAFIP